MSGVFRQRKKPGKGTFCIHCGKPRATIEIEMRGGKFFIHKSCKVKIDGERLALAANGQVADLQKL
jgi:hypothetical protein